MQTSNTIYAKDDGDVTIYTNRVEWHWINDNEEGTEVFSLDNAADELEASGRDDLADLIRNA